jgi:Flp pilus assembly protein TadG
MRASSRTYPGIAEKTTTAARLPLGSRLGSLSCGDAGQSLVELALIVPIFALLILGAVEFGQLVYASIEVSDAARAGVAYGAQSAATAADLAGIQNAAINDAPEVPVMTALPVQFCTCSNAVTTHVSCASAPTTCATQGFHVVNYVQVNTTATITPVIHLPGTGGGFTLYGQAIMRVQ